MNINDLMPAIQLLEKAEENIENEEPCRIYLSANYRDDLKELVLQGNQEGFVTLASMLLELAKKAEDGKHHHLDKSSILEEGNTSVIFSYKSAPW